MSADAPGSPLALAARRHADDVIKPQVREWERTAVFPREAAGAAAADGLLGLFAPAAVGGQAASLAEAMDVFEELGRGVAAYAFAPSMHNAVTNAIARFGGPELRDRYAARLVSGELLGGFSLTEPHAGSDAAAITTRAIEVDDGWRVSGRKAWVSLAGEADVFAWISGRAERARATCSARSRRPADGVRVERLYGRGGAFLPIGGSPHEVHVPHARSPQPGQGMRAARAIDVARVDIAAIAVGGAESLAVAPHTRDRRASGGTLLTSGDSVRARRRRDGVAAGACSTAAAAALDEAAAPSWLAHAKRFCPDAALRAAIACSEVLGAYGLLHEYPLARFLAHAKMLQVVDGSTEVQRIVIARDLARR
jgi:alkylation response protein AidB-like acyl-CoA dehydrogenase